jgi:hypothetical protein
MVVGANLTRTCEQPGKWFNAQFCCQFVGGVLERGPMSGVGDQSCGSEANVRSISISQGNFSQDN